MSPQRLYQPSGEKKCIYFWSLGAQMVHRHTIHVTLEKLEYHAKLILFK